MTAVTVNKYLWETEVESGIIEFLLGDAYIFFSARANGGFSATYNQAIGYKVADGTINFYNSWYDWGSEATMTLTIITSTYPYTSNFLSWLFSCIQLYHHYKHKFSISWYIFSILSYISRINYSSLLLSWWNSSLKYERPLSADSSLYYN